MVAISPRVQRLIVRSFPYLPFKVVYKKGIDIPVTDALSQVTPMDPEDNIQLPIITVNMITRILMSVESQSSFSNKLDQLRKSTVQNNQLTRLRHYINTGFPCDRKNLPTDLHEFWPHRETLSVESGTCGNRIIAQGRCDLKCSSTYMRDIKAKKDVCSRQGIQYFGPK